MVMMWSVRVRLIRSISAHSVVDLPEPVGPGDEHEPLGQVAELLDLGGDPHLLDRQHLGGNDPEHRHRTLAVARRVDAEARQPLDLVREVGVPGLAPLEAVPLRHDREHQQVDLLGAERPRAMPIDLSVGTENGGLVHPEVQIGRLRHHQRPEHLPQLPTGPLHTIIGELGGERARRGRRGLERRRAHHHREARAAGRRFALAGTGGRWGRGGDGRRLRHPGVDPRRDLSVELSAFRRHAHDNEPVTSGVLEGGRLALPNAVRGLAGRQLGEQGIELLLADGLLRELGGLPVLLERHRLVGSEEKLLRAVLEEEVDEGIEACCHGVSPWGARRARGRD